MSMAKPEINASDTIWSWEVFLLGGCSIFVCLACWGFTDKSLSVTTMSQLAFGLAFAVNHPHFLSSYVLLYNDFRKNLAKRPSYIWAAGVVPALLLGALIYGFAAADISFLGGTVNLMFFLVGWHYVKQVFGCVIVTSVRRKIFYGKWERRIILSNLFSLWSVSWLQSQVSTQSYTFYGINYRGLGLPYGLLIAAFAAVTLSGLVVVAVHLRKYIEEGVTPSIPGIAALLSLYVWYLPCFAHPAYAYLIPLFHSLQYLAFVWSFKSNQVADRIHDLSGREMREQWVRSFLGWAAGATILGALAFEFIPKGLDAQHLLTNPTLGASPFLAAFLIFINVHHYFIDNVIWRSTNEEVKKYLFASPVTAAAAIEGRMEKGRGKMKVAA